MSHALGRHPVHPKVAGRVGVGGPEVEGDQVTPLGPRQRVTLDVPVVQFDCFGLDERVRLLVSLRVALVHSLQIEAFIDQMEIAHLVQAAH